MRLPQPIKARLTRFDGLFCPKTELGTMEGNATAPAPRADILRNLRRLATAIRGTVPMRNRSETQGCRGG